VYYSDVFAKLGVFLTSSMSMDDHINFILHTISQHFYLLHQLKQAIRKDDRAMRPIYKVFTLIFVHAYGHYTLRGF